MSKASNHVMNGPTKRLRQNDVPHWKHVAPQPYRIFKSRRPNWNYWQPGEKHA